MLTATCANRLPHRRLSLGAAVDRSQLEGALWPDVGRLAIGSFWRRWRNGSGGALSVVVSRIRNGGLNPSSDFSEEIRSTCPSRSTRGEHLFSEPSGAGSRRFRSAGPRPMRAWRMIWAIRAESGPWPGPAPPIRWLWSSPATGFIRSDGGLGGYRWGLQRKRRLLSLEASMKENGPWRLTAPAGPERVGTAIPNALPERGPRQESGSP